MSDDKPKKDDDALRKEYEERVKRLEKKIEELESRNSNDSRETKEDKDDLSIVGDVVGQFLPGLGGIIKTLEKTSPEFRKRIEDTDEEIRHRIDMGGWSKQPVVEYNISTRPLGAQGPRRAQRKPRVMTVSMPEKGPEKVPIVDVFEEDDHISVVAELPGADENSIEVELDGSYLVISDGKQNKKVELPSRPKSILEKSYKHGILQLVIDKEKDDDQS